MKKIFSLLMVSLMAFSLSAEEVYFVNTFEWESVKVYAWGGSGATMSWPGVDVLKLEEKINGFDVYQFSAEPGSYTKCIFNNNDHGKQTADLYWTAGKYFYNDAWYAKEDIPKPTPEGDVTIHFVSKAAWEFVNAFVWTGVGTHKIYKEWPGVPMVKEEEQINNMDVYACTFPAMYVSISFNGTFGKTVDLAWDAEKPYFVPSAFNGEGKLEGAWYAKEEIPAVDPIDPEVTYFMKNNWNAGEEWFWKAMTKDGDIYKLEEVVFGGTGVNYNTAESDEGSEWVALDAILGDAIEAKDTVAFELDPSAKKVTATLLGKYTEGGVDPIDPEVTYFMKNNWNAGEEWFWKAMTKDGDIYKLEEVVFGGTGVNYNTAESDEGSEWVALDAILGDAIEAKDTVTFELDPSAKKVTATLLGKYTEGGVDPIDPEENITIHFVNKYGWEVVNAYVWPAEGDAYKAWPGEAMTKEAEKINEFDVFAYTFPASFINILFNNGTTQTADLVWDAAKPYFYDGAWYAKEEIPAVEPPVSEDGYYLVGSITDWKVVADAPHKFAVTEVEGELKLHFTLAVGDAIKVVGVQGGNQTWYPDGEGNEYVVDAAHAGEKDIYFRPAYHADWADFGGHIYIAPSAEGIEETLSEGKAVKVLHEGTILIMKGNHSYTPMGQIVK